ncbi:hypothetical protein ALI144C_32155 [Actinosynnema sp. ALI-1.44]|uniref:hypothetical protein n=1 Tax=Actinosynnema sp. ALI-1.44 TaxID=1933779 RepID=UPI00097C7E59|nr:hypothetical protein [Actinosynnema sp. ALI-1.44]ONI78040.1 hypothetical protein ALI144C_32155 [Actinosynnema sp. ALI-1.44]
MLELPGAVFGLEEPIAFKVCANPLLVGGDSVHRRELLSGLVALASTSLIPTGHAQAAGTEPRTVTALRAELVRTRVEFDACHYQAVAGLLPALVADGHRLRDATAGQMKERAESVLADAYSLAAFTADKLGDWGLSWVLADRARRHATVSGNPLSVAAATREAAVAMRRAQHHGTAAELLTTTATSLPAETGWDLVGQGSLLLTAAYTHAQQGDTGAAHDLAAEARGVAARLPAWLPSNPIFTASQVPVYEISIHNALGDPAQALTVARGLRLGQLPSAERRARVCIDVARAWHAYGRAENCLRALEHAERYAPEEVRRGQIRQFTLGLLELPGVAPTGLRVFAARTGADASL